MAQKTRKDAADYIRPLNMNGLRGRMLRIPPPEGKKREILFVYGHHSSLERWWGMIQDLNQYGGITVPDLPGFGGMDSFYKIGRKPTIDNMADYLAAFVKLRYKRQKVTIMGLSYGFVIATRMLQRYPDLVNKVDIMISIAGFSHRDDFSFNKFWYWFFRSGGRFYSGRITSFLFEYIALNPLILKLVYSKTYNGQHKFKNVDKAEKKRLMNFEVYLWHANDVRTWSFTGNDFLKLDNCGKQIDLPLWHVGIKSDNYFDSHLVEQHLNIIFNKVHAIRAPLNSHAPTIIAELEEAAPFIPKRLRRLLDTGK